MCLLGQCMI
ncbi:hypothetical protein LINGRAHAP2_LOCUS31999 [Linum grandiflorum]